MTRSDYHVTMKDTVGIAELKARLSEYLRRVRRGAHITVLDRDTPVAQIEPVAAAPTALTVRHPSPDAPRPGNVRFPAPLKLRTDVLQLLAHERGAR
jgi:prevent-host-death family protein